MLFFCRFLIPFIIGLGNDSLSKAEEGLVTGAVSQWIEKFDTLHNKSHTFVAKSSYPH
jgi:hypothetical protein